MSNSHRAAAQLCRSQPYRLLSRRTFSTSSPCRRKGELATFPTTSSSELDAIISTFRTNVFIPNHVGRGYRDMIYKPAQQYYLTGEEPVQAKIRVRPATLDAPIPTEVEPTETPAQDKSKTPQATAPPVYPRKKPAAPKESILLTPLNTNTDEPKTRTQYIKMLSLMQTPDDFRIVGAFIRELHAARKPVTASMLAKTVRRGSELDSMDKVIDMFRNIRSTGASIKHPFIIQQVLLGAVESVVKGMWAQSRLDESLRHVDNAISMMVDPKHDASWTAAEQRAETLESLPYVWGTAMALEAMRELRYGKRDFGIGDERGLVPRATKFVETLPAYSLDVTSSKWNVHNTFLATWAPTYSGLKFAIQALGAESELSQQLQSALSTLEPAIAKSRAIVEQNLPEQGYRRGLKLLQDMEQALEVEPPAEQAHTTGFVEAEVEAATDAEADVADLEASGSEDGNRTKEATKSV